MTAQRTDSATNFHTRHPWLSNLALYSPLLIALLLMLPRLAQPNFGLFDDGRTLEISANINHGGWDMSWDSAAGRFRPVYWLYYALVYRLSGTQPFGFFLGNTLILIAIAFLLISLARLLGFNRFQSWAAGLFFVLSGPVIENFYTLSKAEPLQLFVLCLALVLAVLAARSRKFWQKILLIAACFLSFLVAHLIKETTLVVIPISLAWVLLAWLRPAVRKNFALLQPRLVILGCCLVAGLIFFVARKLNVSVSLTGGSYSEQYSFTLGRMLASTVRWGGWLLRDFAYLAPLALGFIFLWLMRKRIDSSQPPEVPQESFQHSYLLLDALVWMAAWMAAYLPWVYMQEYYALPFAAGASFAAGLILGLIVQKFAESGRGSRFVLGLCLALTSLLFLVTIPNNLSNGRIQLAVDDANARMLAYLAQHAPADSTLLLNIQDPNEYTDQIGDFYLPEQLNRGDINLITYQMQPLTAGSEFYRPAVILAVPHITHQPLMSVRLGLFESTQDSWNQSLLGQMGPDWKSQFSFENHFRLFNIDLPRLFCPFIRTRLFCAVPSPLVDRREFSYGWDLYQLQP